MSPAARRSILGDYWTSIALVILVIAHGSWMHGWAEPGMTTWFGATFLLIHAHARRIRNTMLALHEGDTE